MQDTLQKRVENIPSLIMPLVTEVLDMIKIIWFSFLLCYQINNIGLFCFHFFNKFFLNSSIILNIFLGFFLLTWIFELIYI
jgi:hypothetical protein